MTLERGGVGKGLGQQVWLRSACCQLPRSEEMGEAHQARQGDAVSDEHPGNSQPPAHQRQGDKQNSTG